MQVAGIARDLTFDIFKKDGYNFIAPVLESEGKYFIQSHKDESIYELIDMVRNISSSARLEWLNGYLELQEKAGCDVGSIYNHSYKLVEYEPMFFDDDMLRKRDESFHVQPDIDVSGETLILGFSLDNDVFIGNPHFIVGQLEILIDEAKTDEEFDILYRVYGMSEQFEQMRKVINAALTTDLGIRELMKWKQLGEDLDLTMQVEETVKNFKATKALRKQNNLT